MKTLFLPVAPVILLALFGSCLCRFAQAQPTPSDAPALEIRLVTGEKKTLAAPVQVVGSFTWGGAGRSAGRGQLAAPVQVVGSFTSDLFSSGIGNLNLVELDSMDLQGGGFKVVMRDKTLSFTMTASANAALTGVGDWGRETVAFTKIASLKVSHTAPVIPFKPLVAWQCVLDNQETMKIGLGWGGPNLLGHLGPFSATLQYDHVKEIVFDGNKSKVQFSDGYVLSDWMPTEKTFDVQSQMGHIQINWSSVRKLQNEAPANEPAFVEADSDLLVAANVRLPLPKLASGQINGTCAEAAVECNLSEVSQITKSNNVPGSFTLTFFGGNKLEGFVPKDSSASYQQRPQFSAQYTCFAVSVSWDDLDEWSHRTRAASAPLVRDTWGLTTRKGLVCNLRNIDTGHDCQIEKELMVNKLDWNFVKSTRNGTNCLVVQLVNGVEWTLSGGLTAQCAFGSLSLDSKDVAELKRDPLSSVSSVAAYSGPAMVGVLHTVSGRQYPVSAPTLAGGTRAIDDKDYWGYDLIVIQSSPVQCWTPTNLLCSYKLETRDGSLYSQCPSIKDFGPLNGITALSFKDFAGEFTAPLAVIRDYVPQVEPSQPDPVFNSAAKAKFRVKISDGVRAAATYEAVSIQFIRYPKFGWSGSYGRWEYPFQWHQSDELLFKSQDGSRVDVPFDKLRVIELTGSYLSGRKARLTNATGATLVGEIYPGDVAVGNHGISDWEPSKEGLSCELKSKLYIYVPFENVRTIEIEAIKQP